MNKEVKVAVKTPFGLTDGKTVKEIVIQGETFGPLCCSVRVDSFGKECIQQKVLEKHVFNRRNCSISIKVRLESHP